MEKNEQNFGGGDAPQEEISQVEITPEIEPEISVINGALEKLRDEEDEHGEPEKKDNTIH